MGRLDIARTGLLGLLVSLLVGCAATSSTTVGETQRGNASWYGKENGGATSSGEHFDPGALTAAHRNLPFGTIVRVTNEMNGKSVEVRINDRGPFTGGDRIIDLSSAAADELDMKHSGIVPVEIDVIRVGDGKRS